MAARTTILRTMVLCVALTGAATACGDDDTDVVDLAEQVESVDRPDWLPPEWDPPEGARLIEVIDAPATDFEPSATYVVDRDFDEVLADVQRILDTLRWTPRDIADPRFGLDEGGSSHQYIYLDNGRVQSIRVYSDPNLSGTRVTVEAPAGTDTASTDESTPDDEGTTTTTAVDDEPSSTTTSPG